MARKFEVVIPFSGYTYTTVSTGDERVTGTGFFVGLLFWIGELFIFFATFARLFLFTRSGPGGRSGSVEAHRHRVLFHLTRFHVAKWRVDHHRKCVGGRYGYGSH